MTNHEFLSVAVARKAMSLTQDALGALLKVDRRTIAAWESPKGQNTMSFGAYKQLVKLLRTFELIKSGEVWILDDSQGYLFFHSAEKLAQFVYRSDGQYLSIIQENETNYFRIVETPHQGNPVLCVAHETAEEAWRHWLDCMDPMRNRRAFQLRDYNFDADWEGIFLSNLPITHFEWVEAYKNSKPL